MVYRLNEAKINTAFPMSTSHFTAPQFGKGYLVLRYLQLPWGHLCQLFPQTAIKSELQVFPRIKERQTRYCTTTPILSIEHARIRPQLKKVNLWLKPSFNLQAKETNKQTRCCHYYSFYTELYRTQVWKEWDNEEILTCNLRILEM